MIHLLMKLILNQVFIFLNYGEDWAIQDHLVDMLRAKYHFYLKLNYIYMLDPNIIQMLDIHLTAVVAQDNILVEDHRI